MMKITILRGLPGSGKSTYIDREIRPQAKGRVVVCSADHYMMVDGQYMFSPEKLPVAHSACLTKFLRELQSWRHLEDVTIVVDNTSLTVAEIAPYVALAQAFGHDAEIVTLEVPITQSIARNTHGVTEAIITEMAFTLRDEARLFPAWWKVRTFRSAEDVLSPA